MLGSLCRIIYLTEVGYIICVNVKYILIIKTFWYKHVICRKYLNKL